jgi:ELWxxDGT repeat protein
VQSFYARFESLTALNGKLYFVFRTETFPATPSALWESDGTNAGTHIVTDLPGFSYGDRMYGLNGKLYFVNSNSATGRELWTSDGTSSGTHLVRDINLGTANSDVSVVGNKNGYLYFTANDGQHGQELWRTDGTSSGTTLVVDLTPGSASSSGKFTSVGDGWVYSDTLASVGDVHSRMVWIEEHSGGPVSLFEVPQAVKWEQITNITRVGSKIVFYALEANQFNFAFGVVPESVIGMNPATLPAPTIFVERKWKLYVSDGTAAGTYAVVTKPYNADENLELAVDGSRVYFVQNGDIAINSGISFAAYVPEYSGTEVWVFDTNLPINSFAFGNATINPQAISNIAPGPLNSAPGRLTVIGGKLYFVADDPQRGRELFVYTPAPPPPSVSLEVDRSQINENGGTATVRVVLSETQSQDVIVTLGDIFFSSSDYQLSATTISIPAGQLSGSVLLSAINDSISEPSETATVRILSVSQGVSIARSAASVQILDDDRFVLNQGTLTITGDTRANVVKLVRHNINATFEVTIDGEVRTFNIADVSRIVLDGATGDDSLEFFGNQYSGEHLAFTPSGFTGTSDATQLSAAGFETITVQGSYLDPPLANSIYPAILIGDTLSFIGGSGVDVLRQTSTGISASGRGYSYQIVDSNWGVSSQLLGTEDVHIVGDRVQFAYGFVTVTGTTGNDQITIDRSNSSVLVVTVNGETSTVAVSALYTGILTPSVNVTVDGLAGNDIYTVIGSSVVTEYVSMGSTGVFYSGGTVSINANNVENSTFNGQSQDTANFFGSSGDDTFRGFSTYASLIGTGYVVLANHCGMVYAGQGGGGNDVALLYDTIGDDTFTIAKHSEMSAPASFPQGTIVDPDVINLVSTVTSPVNYSLAVLQGAGYRHQVVGFGKTYAFASGGNDTATFKTARNLSTGLPPSAPQVAPSAFFYGLAPYSVLVDGSLVMQATGFDRVSADATDAFASSIMYDSPGNDTYIGELYHSTLSGPGYTIDSRGFRYNYAIRGSGGTDTAVLQDSALRDTLLVYPGTTTLHFGVAGFQQLIAFPDVTAKSTGNDSAYFFDSAGNDQFQISGRESRFTYGSGASLRARLFDFVYASSSGGGNDTRSGESPSWLQYVGNWRDQTTSSSGGGSTTPSRTPFRFGRSGSV